MVALGSAPRWFVVAALKTDFRPRQVARLAATHPGLALRLLRVAR